MVFSIFTRIAVPLTLGFNVMRTVRPLMFGATARALCDMAQAEYQRVSIGFCPWGCVAQDARKQTNDKESRRGSVMMSSFVKISF